VAEVLCGCWNVLIINALIWDLKNRVFLTKQESLLIYAILMPLIGYSYSILLHNYPLPSFRQRNVIARIPIGVHNLFRPCAQVVPPDVHKLWHHLFTTSRVNVHTVGGTCAQVQKRLFLTTLPFLHEYAWFPALQIHSDKSNRKIHFFNCMMSGYMYIVMFNA